MVEASSEERPANGFSPGFQVSGDSNRASFAVSTSPSLQQRLEDRRIGVAVKIAANQKQVPILGARLKPLRQPENFRRFSVPIQTDRIRPVMQVKIHDGDSLPLRLALKKQRFATLLQLNDQSEPEGSQHFARISGKSRLPPQFKAPKDFSRENREPFFQEAEERPIPAS